LFDEVKSPDFVTKAVIEAMGRVVRGIAVENEDVTASFVGKVLAVFDEQGAKSARTMVGVDDEVVDFEITSAPDLGGDPGTSKGEHFAISKNTEWMVVGVLGRDRFKAL